MRGLPAEGVFSDVRRLLFVATTGVVIVVAVHFRRYVGSWLIAVGVLMNLLPMLANGGMMPVSYEAVVESGNYPRITEASIGQQLDDSKGVVLRLEDIRFAVFADRHRIGFFRAIFSSGDVVLLAGLVLVVVQAAGGPMPVREKKERRAAVA
jgi:hypothetical protein